MGLLSGLLARPFGRPVKEGASPVPDRRGTPRYETALPVFLSKASLPPYATTLINISTTGAAITLLDWDSPEPDVWTGRLKHGDEIVLTGLLDIPLRTWVVAVDEAILRVRFLVDEAVREKLHKMVVRLAAAE